MFDFGFLPLGLAALTVAAGLVAGVFLTFSDFVMRGLAAAPGGAGAQAMQEINRSVYRSGFMVLFLGLVPVSLALLAAVVLGWSGPAARWAGIGAAAYLLGVFAVTGFGNVPMNKRLDALAGEGRAAYWPRYRARWGRLNHLRTAASALSAAAFLMAALSAG